MKADIYIKANASRWYHSCEDHEVQDYLNKKLDAIKFLGAKSYYVKVSYAETQVVVLSGKF